MNPVWTDEHNVHISRDQVGFLVETYHTLKGWQHWELRDHPAHTNMSHCPRFDGWCGTTNDVGVNAHGLGEVLKIARNGRMLLGRIEDPDRIRRALEDLGYPELEPCGSEA